MEKLKCLNCDKLKNQLVLLDDLIEWIEAISEDKKVNDFALSSDIAKRICDLKGEIRCHMTTTKN